MIKPRLSHSDLLADIRAARDTTATCHLWWLGQSGFLLQWQGRHLLLDPYLSDSLTRKYAGTDKPHERMTEQVIGPARLDFIDVVTSSHLHTDHLDAETLLPLRRVNPQLQIIVPAAILQQATERLQLSPSELTPIDAGASLELAGFEIFALPSAHETLDRDEQGRFRYLGYVVRCGRFSIYHSGDTVLYDGLVDELRHWSIDLALLPINGRAPERRVAGNLWGREAAWLAHAIDAKCVIPCHYEMFHFNTATSEEFVAECRRLNQPHAVLRAGERWSQ